MSTTDEQRLREFYEAFDEYTANCGHQPTMYDMWLIARGVMYTDGHYVTRAQPQTASPPEPGPEVAQQAPTPAALPEPAAPIAASSEQAPSNEQALSLPPLPEPACGYGEVPEPDAEEMLSYSAEQMQLYALDAARAAVSEPAAPVPRETLAELHAKFSAMASPRDYGSTLLTIRAVLQVIERFDAGLAASPTADAEPNEKAPSSTTEFYVLYEKSVQ